MPLKEKLQQDLNAALKNREDLKRLVLSTLLSAIHNKEIEKRTVQKIAEVVELTDEEIIKVIQSEIKKRKEAVELYEKGSRLELAKKEKDEMNILLQYVGPQMGQEELRKIIKETIQETGAKEIKDMGKVIAGVMAKAKGKADGKEVSRIVKEELVG
mgnify:CR=1 FL=1